MSEPAQTAGNAQNTDCNSQASERSRLAASIGLCSHDEIRWGRNKETIGGKEITVCGRCREEIQHGQ